MSLKSFTIAKLRVGRLIAAFVMLMGAGHVVATVIYLLPASPLQNAAAGPVFRYINTIFSQNWHLFSPHPGSSYVRIQVRCQQAGAKWSEWIDPLAKIEEEHFRTRISGRGKVLYVYRRIGEGVLEDFSAIHSRCRKLKETVTGNSTKFLQHSSEDALCHNQNSITKWVQSRPKYQLAQNLADATCRSLDTTLNKISSQIRLVRFEPLVYSQREIQNPMRKVVVLPLYKTSEVMGETSNAEY